MTRHRHKIIGHISVTITQQRSLVGGATLDLPLTQFRERIKWEARIGDLAWVQEPWCELTPHGVGIPGHFVHLTKDRIPAYIQRRGYKMHFHDTGAGLQRRESRFTAEVMGMTPCGTVRLMIHAVQIDQYAQALRRAA